MSDDDAHDTRVLPREHTAIDFEGTAELDRAALLAALSRDRGPGLPAKPPSARRDTEQTVAIGEQTMPTSAGAPRHDVTQHYQVPHSLLEQARQEFETIEVEMPEEDDDDLPTANFSMDSFVEFEAVIDAEGRIALPASALKGRFGAGTRLFVVARLADE